ncbi:amidase [Sphingosinicella rhizophila]|uniref:Amidase n=1 Tax=Sphingosinicella rhizophila TaxID=3050082 RepID=A0ABU3Q4M9_9SPHN|nr:amidase [Sphingosinicella sp. GR2756]MDT9598257.1 amidase [Sphingosinicella sp. GR2756]
MNRRDLCLAMAAGAGNLFLLSHAAVGRAATLKETESGDPTQSSLAAASRAIRRGETSCVELIQGCLRRIETENPKVNAIITTMRDQALAQAAALDAEARNGRFRSPLHGIPIALKDNIDTAGARTTNASALQKDRIPAQDARVVQQLKQAGAVIIAKTNLSEFALASATSASSFFGPVRNPWSLDRVSGGSSGGSAAAVATGMCFGALGTDSGGSVRIPSAWCGLTGLKPTLGLVPATGIGPGVPLLDTCGPMAHTAEDVALLFEHMTGYDPIDVVSLERPRELYSARLGRPLSDLRVGVPRRPHFEGLDAQVANAVEAALTIVAGIAGSVEDVAFDVGEMPDIMAAMADIYSDHRENLAQRNDLYQTAIRRALEGIAAEMNPPGGPDTEQLPHYIRSRTATLRFQRTADAAFKGFDVVVMPTIKILPQTLKSALDSEYGSGPPNHGAIVANTMIFNIMGLPALTVPCGFSREGLPIGLMICGPRYSEATLLALGAAYQRSTSWHTRRPARNA